MVSKLQQVAEEFISVFGTLNPQALESITADDYSHIFNPASLNMPGPLNKQEFINHYASLQDVMVNFPLTGEQYIVSESSKKVVVYVTSDTFFRNEVKDDSIPEGVWRYKGEYVYILTIDEKQEKVVQVWEFLDSKKTAEGLAPLIQRARENLAKKV